MLGRSAWPAIPLTYATFREPPRDYGILPFWFLNGRLEPDEMRRQLQELRDKGMAGVILHGRYGLDLPYLGPDFRDRVRLAVAEGTRLGLQTWLYDEMNWPSGTADKAVLRERPDLAQRYIECVHFAVRGPWFIDLTAADSRYLDFERSTPVGAYAIADDGHIVDLTPNLSFENVMPWQVPPGNWRIMFIVEKRADYYIDALDPDATAAFLRLGYQPYADTLGADLPSIVGFYTDEPAMHYYVTAGENAIVPWTKDMFRRFQARNGYSLRERLPELFFDVGKDSARLRYDFYTSITDFYAEGFFGQIGDWCRERGLLFTGHLLYEEWLRRMIRVAGNPFRHYPKMDVVGVDHLYPIVGSRDQPREHVAMKLASSAAHQQRSPRVLCESFAGIFMDATMQRMKWLTDWEYVLGVNLLNPHGFHYTLEGPRKRDWPPSMFYQYPWWHYYGAFSDYVARLSQLLSGGRHVAKVAMLWPFNALVANYIPQTETPVAARIVADFEALTDMLLRVHADFDYLDEMVLATADVSGGRVTVADEAHELIVIPPMTHMTLAALQQIERFVAGGGRVLGTVLLPRTAFGDHGQIDIGARIEALFGAAPAVATAPDVPVLHRRAHADGGAAAFLETGSLARLLPRRLRDRLGWPRPEHPDVRVEAHGRQTRHVYAPQGSAAEDITAEVVAEREAVTDALAAAVASLIEPDIRIGNREIFYLHRVKDGRDLYFLANPTFAAQSGSIAVPGTWQPAIWDPSTAARQPVAPLHHDAGWTVWTVDLPPAGSAFILLDPPAAVSIAATDCAIRTLSDTLVEAETRGEQGFVDIREDGRLRRLQGSGTLPAPIVLDGDWTFVRHADNALVLSRWQAKAGVAADDEDGWLDVGPGAWAYQLPAEPEMPYPVTVWYRAEFAVDAVPSRIDLLVDGFAGRDRVVRLNGQEVTAPARRSAVDAEIGAIDLTPHVSVGRNVLLVRLVLAKATDGLLDLMKLVGDFALAGDVAGGWRIAAPRSTLATLPWTAQGFPFLSGRATYGCRFDWPATDADVGAILEPALADDAMEVHLNGQLIGVRLWAPYGIDVSEALRPGENALDITLANTPVNLLEGTARPSGLAGPPRLVPYRRLRWTLDQSLP